MLMSRRVISKKCVTQGLAEADEVVKTSITIKADLAGQVGNIGQSGKPSLKIDISKTFKAGKAKKADKVRELKN